MLLYIFIPEEIHKLWKFLELPLRHCLPRCVSVIISHFCPLVGHPVTTELFLFQGCHRVMTCSVGAHSFWEYLWLREPVLARQTNWCCWQGMLLSGPRELRLEKYILTFNFQDKARYLCLALSEDGHC